MTEKRLMFIDIETESRRSKVLKNEVDEPIWNRSDNSFRFNFFTDSDPPPQQKQSSTDRSEAVPGQTSFRGGGSAFAFNFQITPETSAEVMDTTVTTNSNSGQDKKTTSSQSDTSVQVKSKKKNKSSKKQTSESKEKAAENIQVEEDLSAEEQLNRQLDWCIEQLELGMRSQKGTPKQKEEASRALKTLRSSKAPLIKKRQVMRAMTGDYRKKMEEEKSKQFKLIQNEISSAQVKVAPDGQKMSVFHRRKEDKTQTSKDSLQQSEAQAEAKQTLQRQEDTPAFVLVPSNEEFCFNFF